MFKIITVWGVHQGDTDTNRGYPKWFFDNPINAEACAKGRGWYGGKAPIEKYTAIQFEDNAYILLKKNPVKLNYGPEDELAKKEKALKKLTPEERKLLGL